jgi:hypothetical protein
MRPARSASAQHRLELRRDSGEMRAPSMTALAEADGALADDAHSSRDARQIGVAAFAGFGVPPRDIVRMPGYALRVLGRVRVLKRALAVARAQSSSDVPLYEEAIRSAHLPTVAAGIATIAWTVIMIGLGVALVAWNLRKG